MLRLPSHRLAQKGLTITDHGVSVKTEGRFDREDYVDATQRFLAFSLLPFPRLTTMILQ